MKKITAYSISKQSFSYPKSSEPLNENDQKLCAKTGKFLIALLKSNTLEEQEVLLDEWEESWTEWILAGAITTENALENPLPEPLALCLNLLSILTDSKEYTPHQTLPTEKYTVTYQPFAENKEKYQPLFMKEVEVQIQKELAQEYRKDRKLKRETKKDDDLFASVKTRLNELGHPLNDDAIFETLSNCIQIHWTRLETVLSDTIPTPSKEELEQIKEKFNQLLLTETLMDSEEEKKPKSKSENIAIDILKYLKDHRDKLSLLPKELLEFQEILEHHIKQNLLKIFKKETETEKEKELKHLYQLLTKELDDTDGQCPKGYKGRLIQACKALHGKEKNLQTTLTDTVAENIQSILSEIIEKYIMKSIPHQEYEREESPPSIKEIALFMLGMGSMYDIMELTDTEVLELLSKQKLLPKELASDRHTIHEGLNRIRLYYNLNRIPDTVRYHDRIHEVLGRYTPIIVREALTVLRPLYWIQLSNTQLKEELTEEKKQAYIEGDPLWETIISNAEPEEVSDNTMLLLALLLRANCLQFRLPYIIKALPTETMINICYKIQVTDDETLGQLFKTTEEFKTLQKVLEKRFKKELEFEDEEEDDDNDDCDYEEGQLSTDLKLTNLESKINDDDSDSDKSNDGSSSDRSSNDGNSSDGSSSDVSCSDGSSSDGGSSNRSTHGSTRSRKPKRAKKSV